jgi:hypothetical protein
MDTQLGMQPGPLPQRQGGAGLGKGAICPRQSALGIESFRGFN